MTDRVPLGRLAFVAAGVALAGAFAFGAWHVVVGGGLHGNPRAAGFGAALMAAATAAGVLLAAARRFATRR